MKYRQTIKGQLTKEGKTWRRIKERCNNPNRDGYHKYGGRGIECRYPSFQDFISDVGFAPANNYQIDRIEVNKHYEPGNCRWVTDEQQRNNRRDSVFLTINGEKKTATQWGRITGLRADTIAERKHRGLPDDRCILPSVAKGYGTYRTKQGKWEARIIAPKTERRYLGTFPTQEQAIEACQWAQAEMRANTAPVKNLEVSTSPSLPEKVYSGSGNQLFF